MRHNGTGMARIGTAAGVLALVLTAAGLLAAPAAPAAAATPAVGNDISWPQCPAPAGYGNPMPADGTGFVVLGLTSGLPFTANPCLADQARWIRDRARPFSAYTMSAYPTKDQLITLGSTGPFQSGDPLDAQRNAGYAEALDAVAGLHRIGLQPPRVWIDVEARKGQPWPAGAAAQPGNRAVLAGLLAGFAAAGLNSGFYANASDWTAITGDWQQPEVPFWATVGTRGQAAAAAKCSAPGPDGGPVHQVQWWTTSPAVDYDLACPGHEPAAPGASLAWPTASGSGWSVTPGTPGLTVTAGPSRAQAWSLTAQDACTGVVRRTIRGTSSDLISVAWDGTADDGTAAPGGVYRLTLRTGIVPNLGGPSWVAPLHELVGWGSTRAGGCRVTRTAGTDVYATAVAVGQAAFPASRLVVLASGEAGHLVDAVTAGPYARVLRAPLLLTATATLPDVVTAELQRRGATQVIVVGGPSAVSSTVTDALAALGVRVARVAGADRYATAALLASRIGGAKREIVVASGADPTLSDALLAAGPAGGLGVPVLLTGATSVPAATLTALRSLGSAKGAVTVVGGTSTVSAAVLQVLQARSRSVRRLAGVDPASTAVALASAYAGRMGPGGVVVVNAGAPVSTLAATGLGRVTLLTAAAAMPASTSSWLGRHPGSAVRVVGGPTLVTPAVIAAIG